MTGSTSHPCKHISKIYPENQEGQSRLQVWYRALLLRVVNNATIQKCSQERSFWSMPQNMCYSDTVLRFRGRSLLRSNVLCMGEACTHAGESLGRPNCCGKGSTMLVHCVARLSSWVAPIMATTGFGRSGTAQASVMMAPMAAAWSCEGLSCFPEESQGLCQACEQ